MARDLALLDSEHPTQKVVGPLSGFRHRCLDVWRALFKVRSLVYLFLIKQANFPEYKQTDKVIYVYMCTLFKLRFKRCLLNLYLGMKKC